MWIAGGSADELAKTEVDAVRAISALGVEWLSVVRVGVCIERRWSELVGRSRANQL